MENKGKVSTLSYFFAVPVRLVILYRYITDLLIVVSVVLFPVLAQSQNNIEFLDKEVIQKLTTGVYEVVVPKIESIKIKYSRELPFDGLGFRERNEKHHSVGTAFFINETELMSAAHVFELQEFSLLHNFYIRDTEGGVYKVGKVKKYSSIIDVIVFELEEYPEVISPLKFSNNIEIGDTVFSVGNAQGEGISFRAGQVASFTLEPDYGEWKNIRFTSPASPGNSGGPLVDVEGNAVGLIVRKSSSENHNVAVPVSEIENLKPYAEFYLRNVTVNLSNEQNNIVRNWSESYDLPETVGNLSRFSQKSLNEFYETLGKDLEEKFKDVYFPRGKRFRAYLRNQQYVRQFGVLKSDADFNEWGLKNHGTKKIPLEKNQDIAVGKSEISSFHIVIDKPKGASLSAFVNDPELVMDNILKGIPLTRTIGVEKIRIVSLGTPEKSEIWEDAVGRKWTSSLWFLPYANAFVYSHCLPYPKGLICNFDFKNNSELNKGYLSFVKQDYDEIAVGYEGEVADWLEYFSLNKKQLPKVFGEVVMRLGSDVFELRLTDYDILLNGGKINNKSNIHFHFGYSNTDLLAEDLLLFEIFPRKGVSSHFRVQKYYSPSEFSSDVYKSSWEDIRGRSGDYSGALVKKSQSFTIRKVIDNTEENFVMEDGSDLQSVYVVGCIHDTLRKNIESECEDFSKGVRFKSNNPRFLD